MLAGIKCETKYNVSVSILKGVMFDVIRGLKCKLTFDTLGRNKSYNVKGGKMRNII